MSDEKKSSFDQGVQDGKAASDSATDWVGCALTDRYHNPPSSDPSDLKDYNDGFNKGFGAD